MFEVWFNYIRPHHSWESTDGNKTGSCRHCRATHSGAPASVPPCAAREGRMIVDGRTQAEAEEYIRQNGAQSELQYWEVRPEKPVKLWSGAHVHHKGAFASERTSVAEARRHVESESKLPFGIFLDGRLARRSPTLEDAELTVANLRAKRRVAGVDGELTVGLYAPVTHPHHVHHRADARAVHAVGDWAVYPGTVIGKFDTVEEAERHRDLLLEHTKASADVFTITTEG